MFKKILITAALAAALVTAFVFMNAVYAEQYNGTWGESVKVNWSLDTESGALNITGSGAMEDFNYYGEPPWYSYRNAVKSVSLSNGITRVPRYAFAECRNLTTVSIPAGVTEIGDGAFRWCVSLESVSIPGSVEKVGSMAFSDCAALSNVTLGAGVKYIDSYAFENCASLSEITVPASAYGLGSGAFSGCTSLTDINAAAGSEYFSSVGGVLFSADKTTLRAFPGGRTGEYTIPAGVTSVDGFAFYRCALSAVGVAEGNTALSAEDGVLLNKDKTAVLMCPAGKTGSYTAPETVVTVEWSAFAYSSLSEINLGAALTTVRYDSFTDCSALTDVNVSESNKVFSSVNGVLFNKDRTEIILFPQGKTGNILMPDGLLSITESAFSGCLGITGVVFPDSVQTIGNFAFMNCSNLSAVTFGSGLKSIGEMAFEGTALTEVYYNGTAAEWEKVTKGANNWKLVHANILYKTGSRYLFGIDILTLPTKTVYDVGEEFSPAGLTLTATYTDGTTETVTSGFTCSEVSTAAAGGVPVTVTYEGKTATFSVSVREKGPKPDQCGEKLFWSLSDWGVLVISGRGDMYDYTGAETPWFERKDEIVRVNIIAKDVNISDGAFAHCEKLSVVNFEQNVLSLGKDVFAFDTALTAVNASDKNTVFSSEDGVLFNADKTKLILCPAAKTGDYTIPASVKTVGRSAFPEYISLSSVSCGGTGWADLTIEEDNGGLINLAVNFDLPTFAHEKPVIDEKYEETFGISVEQTGDRFTLHIEELAETPAEGNIAVFCASYGEDGKMSLVAIEAEKTENGMDFKGDSDGKGCKIFVLDGLSEPILKALVSK
ncbi:MAG: leucine-rich repeat protein [Clostridia bacterium]|nr:leucine-rich repeat protein [Clostridia bacterium]